MAFAMFAYIEGTDRELANALLPGNKRNGIVFALAMLCKLLMRCILSYLT